MATLLQEFSAALVCLGAALGLSWLDWVSSKSGYVPCEGVALERLVSQLSELYTRCCDERDQVRLAYRTRLYLATL